MVRNGIALFMVVLAGASCATDTEPEIARTAQSLTLNERIVLCAGDPRVAVGKLTVDTCVGGDLFLRETFEGNGRSCATCHRVERNFGIDPDFMLGLEDNDPLFIAEFNPQLADLEIPVHMRNFGLILENVDGFEPDPRRVFVLRAIPHTLSLGTSVTRAPIDPVTPPIERTGWSGDGAPGAGGLRDFQQGAITQHYPKTLRRVVGQDFRLAEPGELDRMDRFMRRVGRTNELDLGTVVMADRGAEIGRSRFLAVGCNACHTNAGANAAFAGGNFNFNTGVEAARNPDLRLIPIDGGFLRLPENGDGSFGDRTFNTPPLVEAADTGPFFHTATSVIGASAHNAPTANTIEQAIAFYDTLAFNSSPSGQVAPIDLSADDIDNIGRFLRAVNATFNIALANKRLDAALALVNRFGNTQLAVQRQMLQLAFIETQDAVAVLNAIPEFHAEQVDRLGTVRSLIFFASTTSSIADRRLAIQTAINFGTTVSGEIGTNLTYQMGDGNVMF
jgi:cytochrome c peroxidase